MRAALKLAEALLSPERQALADAIAAALPARAALDEARARAASARAALAEARASVPAAEKAVEAAKAYLIENPHASRAELREKRQAAADAVDDLAIVRAVAERVEEALVAAEREERYANEAVEAAADAVLVTSFGPALEAAERAGREFARLAFAARTIAQSANHWNGDRTRLVSRVDTLNAHLAFRGDGAALDAVQREAAAPWCAARAALLIDPAAPLPEVS